MINLLPPPEKKKLLEEFWLRLGVVVLCSIFALEILSAVLFIPSYYALFLSTGDLARSLAQKQAIRPEGSITAQQSLATINGEIALLKPGGTVLDVPISTIVQEITAQMPQGVLLRAFAYLRTADGISVQLSGNARTQEDLFAFRRNVKTNPRVLDFKYGSSFVTQKTNIDFSTVITFQ